MAKGSVRKKGKKWYYRFYVEDASGNRVQKEFPGTESKSETESLLRKAMEDYETKMFLAQAKNITLGDMLDMWVEEELKPGSLSDGTVTAYINTVSRIKKHPIGKRKLKTVTSDHLQSYMDLLSFGGTSPDGKTVEALSKGSLGQWHELHVGEAFLLDVVHELLGQVAVGQSLPPLPPSSPKIRGGQNGCLRYHHR